MRTSQQPEPGEDPSCLPGGLLPGGRTGPLRWQRIRPGRRAILLWLITRAVMLALVATPLEREVNGDPFYYWRKIGELATAGLPEVMLEYPVPAVWALQVPYLLGGGREIVYAAGFVAAMLLLDAAFTWLLWRACIRHRPGASQHAALQFWLFFLAAIGPLVYFRFDMLPAVLLGAALFLAASHPRTAGALIAAGAAVKLWPALIWPALTVPTGARRGRLTAGFVSAGVLLAGISLIVGGWDRLVSPLTWQSDRGLQIESVLATPLMLARLWSPQVWQVRLSEFNAYEVVSGPGIGPLLTASTVATALGLVLISVLCASLAWPRPKRAGVAAARTGGDPWRYGLVALAIVLIMIATNKTFSPQYVLWLAGPMSLLLLASPRRARPLAWAMLALALLTQVVYPIGYAALVAEPTATSPVPATLATLALTVRNLGLLALTGWVVRLALKSR